LGSFRCGHGLGHIDNNDGRKDMVSSESIGTKNNGLTRFRCRGGSGVEGMMKGIGIAMLLMLLMSIGCATPYAQQRRTDDTTRE
jgi:hypothetical protein